jgi:hypothetical protein
LLTAADREFHELNDAVPDAALKSLSQLPLQQLCNIKRPGTWHVRARIAEIR